MCLGNNGRVMNQELATGNVGVIDVGGKTTNLLSVTRLSEISRETVSIPLGAWDVVRAVKTWLAEHCPALNLRDHQVVTAVTTKKVSYYGSPVDLTEIVDDTLAPMAEQVLSEATQLWNGAAGLNVILITGGGARLLGPRIAERFPHGVIVDSPIFGNALGYYKLSQRG
jgi:plasmid segregation protein ParM